MLAKVVVLPTQTSVVPVMAARVGSALTVIDCCAVFVPLQPPVMVKMILQVPAATALTKPELVFTVAMSALLLLHAPEPPLKTTELAE